MIATDPWQSHAARIVEMTPEVTGVTTYHLQIPAISIQNELPFRPGQFNMLYLPGVGESAISVSGYDSRQETWLHTIRAVGNVTRMLARYNLDASLLVRGPFGTPWPLELCGNDPILIVAGGLGLAPLRPAIEWLLKHRGSSPQVTLVYGSRSFDSLLYASQYQDWQRRGLELICTVDRATSGWQGYVGVVTPFVEQVLNRATPTPHLFTCGPEVMMRYVARTALRSKLPPARIWLSLERNMQCAVGFCGHCQLGPAFICKDGPVFRYDRIAPFLDVEQL